ncbi:hydroxyacylglutathione hydrolase [Uliginosibacterium sp. 31-16]|uniref:hydroxyacylglutathione hydrolase n=1 Tax=Uliginosibacterium sp. 31-16 TaxID=3068315 RepID=UPI00273ECC74|nr:hydroxyacylglutathione hydrolase [Uliginosibacterium sp. 31-16]MDP5239884.1 hydroxyacylglutathione hydrolase [Uliginosibacterium sp. 31-16]
MKTDFRIVPLSALRDNYIWALIEGARCVVVDPGEAAPVLAFLAAEKLSLEAILLTHRHADHQGGVAELLAHRAVPVYGPASPAMPQVSQVLVDGQELALDGFSQPWRVLAVPGHTEEHIACLWNGALFCGDTLFAAGCGRLLGGTAPQLFASLQRLAALPAETRVYCAHEYTLSNLAFAAAVEPDNLQIKARRASCETLREEGRSTLPSSLAEERASNPFLRCTEPAVIAAAEKHAGHALRGPLEVFTALRQWKDSF